MLGCETVTARLGWEIRENFDISPGVSGVTSEEEPSVCLAFCANLLARDITNISLEQVSDDRKVKRNIVVLSRILSLFALLLFLYPFYVSHII